MVGLEIGRLIGDDAIGSRMRLVETVTGEFRHQLENIIGAVGLDALFGGALDEARLLRIHLGLDLLAHGAA